MLIRAMPGLSTNTYHALLTKLTSPKKTRKENKVLPEFFLPKPRFPKT